jgi:putative nucleotidyltransferase with HDIG domain
MRAATETILNAVETDRSSLTLERVVATLGAYPLPQTTIIPILMRMTSDLNTDTRDLARILAADPALSAKVVHLANSPFYGCVRAIKSLTDAIVILGFYTIRSLTAAASAYTLFRRGENEPLEHELWRHSLAVAVAARLVARHTGSRQMEEEMFLVGLLHDIAKLILLQEYPEYYRPVLEEGVNSDLGHLVIEATRLGFTHADLGAVILEQWGFPARMIGVIKRYAIPDLPFFYRGKKRIEQCDLDLPHILCFAHELANALGFSFRERPQSGLASLASARYFNMSQETIADLSRELQDRVADELSFFTGQTR